MMRNSVLIVAGILFFSDSVAAQSTLPDLRQQLVSAKTDGVSATEFSRLSDRALVLTDSAGSRGKFWNVIGFLAELCEVGPYDAVVDVRAQALSLLAQRFTDTHRWSSLVVDRFAPTLERIPRETWRRQIKLYDDALDTPRKSTGSERIKAELLYAKALLRVQINRRWDWLTDKDRLATVRLLDHIRDRYGTLPCPGSRGETVETVGDRAAAHKYELERLHFNAPTLPTAGADLEGKSLDIADLKGNIILLDFWTSFCTPCLAMVPDTRRLLEKYSDKPVVYIGVNGDSTREQGLRTAKRLDMTWRNLWDGGPGGPHGPIAVAWRVNGWPALFVIDGHGRIRYKFWGKDQVDHGLELAISSLLKERKPQS